MGKKLYENGPDRDENVVGSKANIAKIDRDTDARVYRQLETKAGANITPQGMKRALKRLKAPK